MTAPASAPTDGSTLLRHPPDFSLVLGGPLFQLLRRAHLADDALMLVRQRVLVIALVAWLPLLLLSALEDGCLAAAWRCHFCWTWMFTSASGGAAAADHCRAGGAPADAPLLQQFLERNLVPENAMARFEAAIASAFRLRNSVLAEVLLIAIVYGVGILIVWRQYFALDATTWYAAPSAAGAKLSLAGLWFGYVSLPIFQFLLVAGISDCSSGCAFSGRYRASS